MIGKPPFMSTGHLKTPHSCGEVDVITVSGQEDMKNPLVGGRNIRLDIFAKDAKGRFFDCEVQRDQRKAQPRRARFHSAMLDSRMLKSAEEFTEIKDSYVIFITEADYFKEGKPLYFIERKRENGKPFEDGNFIIYVNGTYAKDDDMGHLMEDFRRRDLEGFHNKVLEDGVRHFKAEEEGKAIMCEAVEKYAKEYAKEYAQGQYDKGQKDLVLIMLRNGMTAEAITHGLIYCRKRKRKMGDCVRFGIIGTGRIAGRFMDEIGAVEGCSVF
ncbi:MAG: PD-(D/E)XK nuclease family transposase [Lachnospiraceae bacterium]|nr:PD-(D/E)XK nuclease family transposase [Lachnospiraceae bacterium]